MLTRRQLLFNGIGVGALPIITPAPLRECPSLSKIHDASTALGVHCTVLASVLDRFSDLLPHPGVIIIGSDDRQENAAFRTDIGKCGHWRFDALDKAGAPSSPEGMVGFGCSALASRLDVGAALQYKAGLRMGGLSASFYEGFETGVCLLSRKYADSLPPHALLFSR